MFKRHNGACLFFDGISLEIERGAMRVICWLAWRVQNWIKVMKVEFWKDINYLMSVVLNR